MTHDVPLAHEVSWPDIRTLFPLDPAVAYLNHGGFGVVPRPVLRAQHRLRDEVDTNPMAFYTRGFADRVDVARQCLAEFVHADPDNCALVANATTAVAVVLGATDAGPASEILLTDHGYGAVRLAVQRWCQRTGGVLRELPIPLTASDEDVVESVLGAAQPGRTRLVVLDHVTSPTARRMPIERIVPVLRERGVEVLIDAAHAPGMLPVDVAQLGADYWLGNLHKWAFTPRPCALVAVAPQHRNRIEPLVVSWRQPDGYPAAVEFAGTLDYTAWLAAPAGLAFLEALGPDAVRTHNADLIGHAQRVVAEALDLDPTRLTHSPGISMRLVPLPAGVADDRAQATALRERIAIELACEVALDVWGGHGYLRLAAQVYNNRDEYERLAEALPALVGRAPARAAYPAV